MVPHQTHSAIDCKVTSATKLCDNSVVYSMCLCFMKPHRSEFADSV